MTPRKIHARRHGSNARSSLSNQVYYDNYGQPQPQQQQQQQQQQPYIQPSDYESDGQYMAQQAIPQVISHSASRTIEDVNLAVLQRYNPAISAILSKASYAVVYIFSPSTSSWEKSGIEGTMFVCQLQLGEIGEERFQVIVLNRRGLDNFEADLLDEADVEITEEYVILNVRDEGSQTDQSQKVYGLWIFCEPPPSSTADARIGNANKMKECAAFAEHSRHQALEAISQHQYRQTDGPADGRAAHHGHQVDLLQLFKQQGYPGQPQPEQYNMYNQNQNNGHYQQIPQGTQPVPQQNDVLNDLFRKAGLGGR